jgi:nicotinamide-nucleotide amidase
VAAPSDQVLILLATRLGAQLLQRGRHVATAESCTGGYVAKLLTDVPGSSQWFECGWVTYSNAAKQTQLAVPGAVLKEYGAVSEQTVMAMASGALAASRADITIAISGVAGPDGGSSANPVGTVWFAWANSKAGVLPVLRTQHRKFDGDRDGIRRWAAAAAFECLLDL